jgi:hypothetical protein
MFCILISCAKPTWTNITGFVPGQDEPGKGTESAESAAAAVGVVVSQPPQVEGSGEVVSSSPVRLQQPESEPEEEEEGAGSSAPGSPAPSEPKRRKKVRLSMVLQVLMAVFCIGRRPWEMIIKMLKAVLRIRIPRIRMFLGLLDPEQLVRGIGPISTVL